MATNAQVGRRFAAPYDPTTPFRGLIGSNFYCELAPILNHPAAVRAVLQSYSSTLAVRTLKLPDPLVELPLAASAVVCPETAYYSVTSQRHWSHARWALGGDYVEIFPCDAVHLRSVVACHKTWQDGPSQGMWLTTIRSSATPFLTTVLLSTDPTNIAWWDTKRYGATVAYSGDAPAALTTAWFLDFEGPKKAHEDVAAVRRIDPLLQYHAAAAHRGYYGSALTFTGYPEIVAGKISFLQYNLFLYDCGDGAAPEPVPPQYRGLSALHTLRVARDRTSGGCFRGHASRKGIRIDFRGTAHEGRWFFPYNPQRFQEPQGPLCDARLPAGSVLNITDKNQDRVTTGSLVSPADLFHQTPLQHPTQHQGIP